MLQPSFIVVKLVLKVWLELHRLIGGHRIEERDISAGFKIFGNAYDDAWDVALETSFLVRFKVTDDVKLNVHSLRRNDVS